MKLNDIHQRLKLCANFNERARIEEQILSQFVQCDPFQKITNEGFMVSLSKQKLTSADDFEKLRTTALEHSSAQLLKQSFPQNYKMIFEENAEVSFAYFEIMIGLLELVNFHDGTSSDVIHHYTDYFIHPESKIIAYKASRHDSLGQQKPLEDLRFVDLSLKKLFQTPFKKYDEGNALEPIPETFPVSDIVSISGDEQQNLAGVFGLDI